MAPWLVPSPAYTVKRGLRSSISACAIPTTAASGSGCNIDKFVLDYGASIVYYVEVRDTTRETPMNQSETTGFIYSVEQMSYDLLKLIRRVESEGSVTPKAAKFIEKAKETCNELRIALYDAHLSNNISKE